MSKTEINVTLFCFETVFVVINEKNLLKRFLAHSGEKHVAAKGLKIQESKCFTFLKCDWKLYNPLAKLKS